MPSTTRVTAMSIAAVRIEPPVCLDRSYTCSNVFAMRSVQPLVHVVAGHLIPLRFLGVFEVGDEDAAGVAEDVGDDEDAAGVEDFVGRRR